MSLKEEERRGVFLFFFCGNLIRLLCVYRYDGRGALADLRVHEPPSGGYDQRTMLTEDELRVEQLCDEERYRSLYNNDMEEATYHGE